MKNRKSNYSIIALIAILLIAVSCERKLDGLELATYPTTPDVFIDGFSTGLYYAAYGTSKVTAFSVDKEVKYSGTASMRFDVPDAGDPFGSYVGGVFGTNPGRDLSGYNVLTFWAKSSEPAVIDQVGFANDMGASKYQVSITSLAVNNTWKQFILLIPDPSVLTQERGMLYYSAAPQNGRGFTFWIDDVKFEKIGTIAHEVYNICNGNDLNSTGALGKYSILNCNAIFNLPSGINQTENIAVSYFKFTSSDTTIATVNSSGIIDLKGNGTAKITAKVGNINAVGSYTLTTGGPSSAAPTPAVAAANVISIYSDAYTNVAIEDYCEHWEWGQGQPWHAIITTEYSFGNLNEDNFIHYSNNNDTWGLKRVISPIKFKSNPQNVSSMSYLHYDVWVPSVSTYTSNMPTIALQDAAGVQVGVNSTSSLATDQWVSIDIPLSSYSGIDKSKIAYVVFDNFPSDIYVDNIFFYSQPTAPTTAAPIPTFLPANVISIFSDAYTNVAGTDLNPPWGQETVVTQIPVAGNNTLKYAGLNYQGIQLGSSQNVSGMSFVHLDFWTANSTSLNIYLISTGPIEKAYSLTVPTTGWKSLDIPLSAFSPVNLADIIQFKFDGNGDIFIDNIFFHK